MFKLIIKNLWARRRRNIVLLLELIIITVVAWATLDTVIVKHYVHNMPLGYDRERLVVIEFENRRSDPALQNDSVRESALRHYAGVLEALPEVEMAVRPKNPLLVDSPGYSCSTLSPDTVHYYHVFLCQFNPGWDMFKAFGIQTIGRSPSTEELVTRKYARGEVVISESLARAFFGDKDPVGHYLDENSPDFEEEDAYKVVGVVSDVRTRSCESDAMVYYTPNEWMEYDSSPLMLIRLKEGVSAQAFVNKYREMVMGDFRGLADIYPYKFRTLSDVSTDFLYSTGDTNTLRLRTALAIFFLVNLFLGMVGIFMLQTRKRSEDAGIMLSFGASPGYIRRMLLGEGAVMVTIGWALGCLIFLWVSDTIGGLARGTGNLNADMRTDVPWIASFGEHFAIVSAIIYLLILVTVLLGIYIPAWRISRVNPVDALRDE